jgi:hypothetical protein
MEQFRPKPGRSAQTVPGERVFEVLLRVLKSVCQIARDSVLG